MRKRSVCWVRFSRFLQVRVGPSALFTCVCLCVSFDPCVQAAACDSMTLLMKKLDRLNEGSQEVQSANPSHADEADADKELQSTVVSQVR